MHEVIASPFLDDYLVLRPDDQRAVKIGARRYRDLLGAAAVPDAPCPPWLVDAVLRRWGRDLDGRALAGTVLVREPSQLGYGRASYEINLGCDYDCEHCYLGEKRFAGLDLRGKRALLHALRDAGVLWFQITGGEPLIDPHFADVYRLAQSLGMIIEILSNGSRLSNPKILDVLTAYRPYRISLSVYGTTAETYERLTRRRGSFRRFERGLAAALEAKLPVDLSLIITSHNAHEADRMRGWADRLGLSSREYTHMSPTIYGGDESLSSQSIVHVKPRSPFVGCNAGHTFLHVDPHGMASICKVARDRQIDLLAEGAAGLTGLAGIADALMLRTGGCSGCQLSGQCSVCRPLAKLHQEAKAPLDRYCQHAERRNQR
jgi:sulfatase maturation enzyme AslB (radical SAM superfamily)